MRSPEPQGGGYGTPGTLTLLNVPNAAYVKGVWEGYRDALAWAQKHAQSSLPTTTQWDGDRAERFRSWWTGANADLDRLASGLAIVINALEAFILGGTQVNDQLASIEYLIRSNCEYVWADETMNTICGTFTVQGTPFVCRVTGITLSPMFLSETEWPPWLQDVHSCIYWAESAFLQVSDSANEYLHGAMACFTSMRQFTHLGRSGAVGDGPFAAEDPTWVQLTGGGVFRMPLSGFKTDPFGTRLMPAWYDPTTAQKVSTWIGNNEWMADIGAVVLIAVLPEGPGEAAATTLEVIVHGTKLAIDISDDNKDAIPWDSVDLILDIPGGPSLDTLTESITEHLMYQARHAIDPTWIPRINGSLAAFVQGRLEAQLQQTVTADGATRTTIPASALSQVAAEAQAELNVLLAAGVPPGAASPN